MEWDDFIGVAFMLASIFGLVFLWFHVRRAQRRSQQLESIPLGERVAAPGTRSCALCGNDLSAEHLRVAGIHICDACAIGDFGDRLAPRGLRVQDIRTLSYPREGTVGGTNREIRGAIKRNFDASAFFMREGLMARALNVGSTEMQTGDPGFDDFVYIDAKRTTTLAALLRNPELRAAIRHSLIQAEAGFTVEGNRICFLANSDSEERRARIRCCTAVVLHFIERALSEGAIPCTEVDGRSPDLASLLEHAPTTVARLFISYATIDDLRDVRALHDCQPEDKPLTGLWVYRCAVRGSLAELSAMRSLTFLAFEDVAGLTDLTAVGALSGLEELRIVRCAATDVAPLSRLSNLRELTLEGTPVQDLSPLGGLTSLRELNLRSTKVEDLSPLAALKQLEVLRTLGSLVSTEQFQRLRQALPTLDIDSH